MVSITINNELIEKLVQIKKEVVKHFHKLSIVKKTLKLIDLKYGIRRQKNETVLEF